MNFSKVGRTFAFVVLFLMLLAGINMLVRISTPPIKERSETLGNILEFVA